MKFKFISKSADAVNDADSRGVTLLMHAVSIGTVQAMKALIARGANVDAKSGLDSTALLYAGSDGGWPYLATLPSDAYGSGLASMIRLEPGARRPMLSINVV